MKVLVLGYRHFSPFYYIRLIGRVVNDWKMKKKIRLFSVIFGFHPSGQLAGNKQRILSKICLKAHYCLCIVQLLLSCLLKNNWRLLAWLQLMKKQLKDKNLPLDKMICLLSARWQGGWRPKMTWKFFHFSIVNNHILLYTRKPKGLGFFYESQFRFPSSYLATPK